MNTAELSRKISESTGLTTGQASSAVAALCEVVTASLVRGESVKVGVGFGEFSARKRAARKGVNPRTGQSIDVGAVTVPKFRAGKGLKDALKGK
jgi:DNA-binding protein HU-beta